MEQVFAWGRMHFSCPYGAWVAEDEGLPCAPDCSVCAQLGIVPAGATFAQQHPVPANPLRWIVELPFVAGPGVWTCRGTADGGAICVHPRHEPMAIDSQGRIAPMPFLDQLGLQAFG